MPTDYTPPLPQGMLPMEPVANGKPPKQRIANAAKAQTIVANLWEANKGRNLQNSAYQGQLDGNPPYNPDAMRRAGRAGDANFNTLEAKALCSTAMVPYYDLFAGGNRYIEAMLDIGDDIQSSYMSGIVTEEYDEMLRRWRNYEFTMNGMMDDYVRFGKGFLTWCKGGSWRLQKVAHYRVMSPDATPLDMDEWEIFVLFQNWTVTYLMDQIDDEETATKAGWNVKEVKEACMSAVPEDPAVPNNPMALQQEIKDNDIYVSARNSTVQCATIFVKEFDGKWTEMIVRRDQIPSQQTPATPVKNEPGFLYKKTSAYSSVLECLVPFFFESGGNDFNGVAGIARDIFVPMQLKDRTACSQIDSLFLRNSIILQPRQETDRNKMQVMQLGKLTVLPPGMEAQQSTILGDIASTIEVSRELSTMIERNTGIYRPVLEKGGGNPDTLGEFQTKFAQATVLSSSAITRFYSQLDRMYEEQWKRVVKVGSTGTYSQDNDDAYDWKNEARRFVYRCELRGVPKEFLKRPKYVRAFRAIGQGSAAMRQQIVSTFLNPQVFPLYPPDGQRNILEDFTRTLGGQTAVNRYLPLSSRMGLPNNDQWDAMMENASVKIGAPITWTPKQNNLVHAQVHLTAASQAAASLEQGANPADVLMFIDGLGGHIMEHLQRESAVPTSKPAVKALEAQWKRLAQVADQIRQQIQQGQEEQQRLQQEQQQVLTDADIKMLETQKKLEQSDFKMRSTLDLKKQRQDAEIALKAQKEAASVAMADNSTAADITRQTAKTQSDIEMARMKAVAEANKPKPKPSSGK